MKTKSTFPFAGSSIPVLGRRNGLPAISAGLALRVAAWVSAPATQADTQISWPYRGVTLIARTEVKPRPLRMNIVRVDLTAAGLGFRLTRPGGTLDTVRQPTAELLRQEGAQMAVNAHFYVSAATGLDAELVGFAMSEGKIVSGFESQPVVPGGLDQGYAILPFAPALNLDPQNRATIVHHDAQFPDNRHVREAVQLWNGIAGSAQIVTDGRKTIPNYTPGIGGLRPLLGYSESFAWYDRIRARTAVGLADASRSLVIFTVDEIGGSEGMTVGEVADLLVAEFGVHDALNLDGGPSTTLAYRVPSSGDVTLLNVPSGLAAGNAVGSSLAIFAQPMAPAMRAEVRPSGELQLSWELDAGDWRLEQSESLASPMWLSVTAAAVVMADQVTVTLPLTERSQLFRLRD